jgi:hypothetical protein
MRSKQKRVETTKPTHEMEKPNPGFEKPTPIVRSDPAKGRKRNHERRG